MSRYLFFVVVGLGVYAPLVFPMLLGRIKLHSLYGWMLVSASLGLVGRPTYLLLFSDDRSFDESLFWRDVPLGEFLLPAAFLGLANLCLVGAYIVSVAKSPNRAGGVRRQEHYGAMQFVSFLVALVGILGAVLFVQATGGFDISSLSTKRVVASDRAISAGLQSVGVPLALGRSGLIASVVLLHLRRSNGLTGGYGYALLVANLFLPFYASDRTGVLLVGLQLFALASFASKKLDRRKIVAGCAVALILLQLLTALRVAGRSDQALSFSGVEGSVEVLVRNRSFFDLSKNLQIPRAVGDELELEFGATLSGAVFGPVPRSVWPEKPIVSVGPEIGQKVYGNAVTGVPPGLIGEAFWNFHVFGIGMVIIAGAIFGRLDRFEPESLSPFFQAVFALLVLPVAYNSVGSSFSGVALDLYRDGLTLAILWFGHLLLSGRGSQKTRRRDIEVVS